MFSRWCELFSFCLSSLFLLLSVTWGEYVYTVTVLKIEPCLIQETLLYINPELPSSQPQQCKQYSDPAHPSPPHPHRYRFRPPLACKGPAQNFKHRAGYRDPQQARDVERGREELRLGVGDEGPDKGAASANACEGPECVPVGVGIGGGGCVSGGKEDEGCDKKGYRGDYEEEKQENGHARGIGCGMRDRVGRARGLGVCQRDARPRRCERIGHRK
jgi:hypothetical protein